MKTATYLKGVGIINMDNPNPPATLEHMKEFIDAGIKQAFDNLRLLRNESFHMTTPSGVTIEIKSVEKPLEELKEMALETYNKLNGSKKPKRMSGVD